MSTPLCVAVSPTLCPASCAHALHAQHKSTSEHHLLLYLPRSPLLCSPALPAHFARIPPPLLSFFLCLFPCPFILDTLVDLVVCRYYWYISIAAVYVSSPPFILHCSLLATSTLFIADCILSLTVLASDSQDQHLTTVQDPNGQGPAFVDPEEARAGA